MHEDGVDFRQLNLLKNALFDSDKLKNKRFVPLEVWRQELKLEIHGKVADIESLILEEILGEDGYVDLSKFTDICDLFHYLPIHKKIDKNDS